MGASLLALAKSIHYSWKADMLLHSPWHMFTVGFSSSYRLCRPYILEMRWKSKSTGFTVKTLHFFLQCVFEFLIRSLLYTSVVRGTTPSRGIFPPCLAVFFSFNHIYNTLQIAWFQFILTAALYTFARSCDKRIFSSSILVAEMVNFYALS